MERSEIRGWPRLKPRGIDISDGLFPDFAALHPGYAHSPG
jgi:hypothetical protein